MTAAAKKAGTAPAPVPPASPPTVAAVMVRALTPIRYGVQNVAEGETFACDPDEAAVLVALDVAESV